MVIKMDKSEGFKKEGRTLISECDSDLFLARAKKRDVNKEKEEFHELFGDNYESDISGN